MNAISDLFEKIATLDPCMVAVIIQQLNYGKFL